MTSYILVCIDGHPKSHLLINAALKKIQETGEAWRLVYFEEPDETIGNRTRKEQIFRLLEKAKSAGASIVHLEQPKTSEAKLTYIQACLNAGEKISHIFIGQSEETILGLLPKRSTAEKISHQFGRTVQVTSIPLDGSTQRPSLWHQLTAGQWSWYSIFAPIFAVFIAFTVAEIGRQLMPTILYKVNAHNISLIFLLACVIVALRVGFISALIASALSIVTINFFYVIPLYRFNIGSLADIINIIIFLTAALITSVLGGHIRNSVDSARKREQRSKALYDIHKLSAEADNDHQLLEILDRELHTLFGMEVAFFLPAENSNENSTVSAAHNETINFAAYPKRPPLNKRDIHALSSCWEEESAAGFGTLLGIGASWRFELMETPEKKYGIFGVNVPLKMRLDASFSQLVSAIADHTAISLERIRMAHDMGESRFREEREKLRSMLLSSVSHDLKTPLASIIGSMSVMRSLKSTGRLTNDQQETLTETALEEAQRLDSFITNILSMTRIESGDIEFSTDLCDPVKPLGKVRKILRTRLQGRDLNIIQSHDPNLFVSMDSLMTAQVLQNVVDNAVKYSPTGTAIDVTLENDTKEFRYRIRDRGPGIPDKNLLKVFDKYERLNKADSQVAGTGLGLAIAQSVMQAQGGNIIATNHPKGGAEFVLSFPLTPNEPVGESHE